MRIEFKTYRDEMPNSLRRALDDWLWATGVFYRDGSGVLHRVGTIEFGEGFVITDWVRNGIEGSTKTLVREPPPIAVMQWLVERERSL